MGVPKQLQNEEKNSIENLFSDFLIWGHLGILKWFQKGTQRPASRLNVWPNV
jgi:hypothetical protein